MAGYPANPRLGRFFPFLGPSWGKCRIATSIYDRERSGLNLAPLDTVPATRKNTRETAASFVLGMRACEGVNRRQSWAGLCDGGCHDEIQACVNGRWIFEQLERGWNDADNSGHSQGVIGSRKNLVASIDEPVREWQTGSGKEKEPGHKSVHPKIQMSESFALREPAAEHQLRTERRQSRSGLKTLIQEQDLGVKHRVPAFADLRA
ncbi:hypothetical protein B0H11DRAFT_2206524 [Mycena galericulata]|nr:hypothetical protein B0H11DRAFT_2206524 [Mycena galericulata]